MTTRLMALVLLPLLTVAYAVTVTRPAHTLKYDGDELPWRSGPGYVARAYPDRDEHERTAAEGARKPVLVG